MTERRTERMALAALALSLFALSSGITAAYLTDEPMKLVNAIAAGDVKVKLMEPDWKEENAQNLLPEDETPKNPMVENTGKLDAWIFLSISVPVRTICLVDAQSGRKQGETNTELFQFTADSSWKLIEKTEKEKECVYIFGYQKLVGPGETTTPVFESVKLVNYLEGELTESDLFEMPVKAMALQKNVSDTETEEADLAEIYKIYLEQEGQN